MSQARWHAWANVVGGLLALVAAYAPWWVTSNVKSGTSSLTEFFPGTSLYAGGGGGGGYVPYQGVGLAAVGQLYEVVFAGFVLLTLVCVALAGIGFARARGRAFSLEGRRLARYGAVAAAVLAVALVVGVPWLQPGIYRAAAPAGTCSSGASSGPCVSFWGSTSAGGASISWGAAAGWWLGLSAALAMVMGAALAPAAPVSEKEAAWDAVEPDG